MLRGESRILRGDMDVFFNLRVPMDSLRRVRTHPRTARAFFASREASAFCRAAWVTPYLPRIQKPE